MLRMITAPCVYDPRYFSKEKMESINLALLQGLVEIFGVGEEEVEILARPAGEADWLRHPLSIVLFIPSTPELEEQLEEKVGMLVPLLQRQFVYDVGASIHTFLVPRSTFMLAYSS